MLKTIDYWMITPSFTPSVGGVERHVDSVHRALQAFGLHGNILVLGSPPKEGSSFLTHYIAKPRGRWPKIRRAFLKFFGEDHYAKEVVALLDPKGQSILHFHDYHTLYPFIDVLQRNNMLNRVFLTFHGWEGCYPPKRKVILQRQTCNATARGTIAVGDFIPAWYGTPVDVVMYGGISPEAFPKSLSLKLLEKNLCYLGQFRDDTGLPLLLSAMERLSTKKDSAIRLHAYGFGPMAELMARHKLVTIHPPVTDVSPVILGYPIIVVSGYLSILEALYCRRVVIAMYHNAGRESYLRTHPMAASLFICGNADEFTSAVEQCLFDLDRVAARFEPAWAWAQNQTWGQVAETYLALWNKSE
ncbi:MAG: glycosyltransferase family 4 protein [Magnetococcales bacterium]|nr:glycosyltransferase family 4 protein [Magnetococcales bacterium]